MLAMHPIDVMLTAADLEVVKQFYGDRIGLDVMIETDDFVTFRSGGDSRRSSPAPPRRAPSRRRSRAGGSRTSPPTSALHCRRGSPISVETPSDCWNSKTRHEVEPRRHRRGARLAAAWLEFVHVEWGCPTAG